MAAAARCIGGGIILVMLGLFLGIGWYFAHRPVTHTITTAELRDSLVIESTRSKGYVHVAFTLTLDVRLNDMCSYYAWEEGNAINNPNFYAFYMWNITNPAAVLNGSVALYEQYAILYETLTLLSHFRVRVGPYYYKYIWYNKNASFLDGGNIVEYNLIEDCINCNLSLYENRLYRYFCT
jgi:hypothetical protein